MQAEKTPESDKWTSPSSMTSKSQTPTSRQMTPSTPISPASKGNLRFFGDTDLESVNASISRTTTNPKARKPLNHTFSNSVHNLYHSPSKPLSKSDSREKLRSSSLQQLNNTPIRPHKLSVSLLYLRNSTWIFFFRREYFRKKYSFQNSKYFLICIYWTVSSWPTNKEDIVRVYKYNGNSY